MVWIVDNIVSLVENFTTAATTDPISALLIALGGFFVVAASVAFGVPALGGILDLFVPDTATKRQRRAR